MKKLLSIFALCTLFYATPAYANFVWGEVLLSEFLPFSGYVLYSLVIVLSLAIQALLLRSFIKDISYLQALFAAFIGNLPSTLLMIPYVISVMPARLKTEIFFSQVSMILSESLLMIAILFIIFRYPLKKLIAPVLIGNVAVYVIEFVLTSLILTMKSHGYFL